MRRKVFTIAAGFSAVFCVAAAVLSVHCLDRFDDIGWAHWRPEGPRETSRALRVCGLEGSVWASYERIEWAEPDFAARLKNTTPDGFHARSIDLRLIRNAGMSPRSMFGAASAFAFGRQPMQGPAIRTVVYQARAPGWFLVCVTSLLPIWWLRATVSRALARRTARKQARCVQCGYDLRATPDRCPECGTAPAKGAT
jgi:hypothetical protein